MTTTASTRSSSPTATSCPGSRWRPTSAPGRCTRRPGHAPSHVVLHQPERKLMISGDHLLGRTVLFFDHGHSPDPVGEFLAQPRRGRAARRSTSVLPGHGRPFRDPKAKIAEARRQVDELLGKTRDALAEGEKTGFEIVAEIVGAENVNTPVSAWVAADRPLLPRPPGDPGRGRRRWREPTRSAGGWRDRPRIALPRAVASFTFMREVAAPPETVFDGAHRSPALRGDDAAAQGRARAGGEPAPNGVGADSHADRGRAAAARGSDRLRARRRASPTRCSPGCRSATTSARSSWRRAAPDQDHLRGAHPADPSRCRRRRRRRRQAGDQRRCSTASPPSPSAEPQAAG